MTAQNNPQQMLQAALWYAEKKNWAVFPCYPIPSTPSGKGTTLTGWRDLCRERNPALLRTWWETEHPGANIGCLTGPESGFVVLDIDRHDGMADGYETWELWKDTYVVPDTVQKITGGGGLNLFFQWDPCLDQLPTKIELAPGIELLIRFNNILPPSQNFETGGKYLWEDSARPESCEIALLPDWLKEKIFEIHPAEKSRNNGAPLPLTSQDQTRLLSLIEKKALKTADEEKWTVKSGYGKPVQSHTGEITVPCPFHHDFTPSMMIDFKKAIYHCFQCNIGGTVRELARTLGLYVVPTEYGPVDEGLLKYHMTDTGNAECFVHLWGTDSRFDHQSGKWIFWNGIHWHEDKTGNVTVMAIQTARNRLQAATVIEEEEHQKKCVKWALSTESRAKMESMVVIAQSLPPIADDGKNWDRDIYLMGVGNGVVDLTSGIFREGKQEDMISHISPVRYDENAACPRWQRFLEEIFENQGEDRAETIDWIQKAFGYSLTGNTSEHAFFITWGDGENGKSTFLRVLAQVSGANHAKTDIGTLMVGREGGIRNDLARLSGVRVVTASEAGGKHQLSVALVKELTGEDPISARFLHREFFEFQPKFKIWFATNQRPEIPDQDHGIWRRVKLIPFTVSFEGRHDPNLDHDLISELPGILNWGIEGAAKWLEKGLGELPGPIRVATEEYRQESDPVRLFLAEKTRSHVLAKIACAALYKSYVSFAHANGFEAKTSTGFGLRLKALGTKTTREHAGRYYEGLELLSLSENNEGWNT